MRALLLAGLALWAFDSLAEHAAQRATMSAASIELAKSVNPFPEASGGHYFGEDEPEHVKRLTSEAQEELLYADSDYLHRVQARGQIAQLQKRLDVVNALSAQQRSHLEAILVAERDRQEQDTRRQYASFRISATGGIWHGLYLMASDQLGTPVYEQFMEQTEAYGRRQIRAAATVLTPEQLSAYEQIQHERLAHYRSHFAARRREMDAQERAYENAEAVE
jgi:hypothetical protein